MHGWLIKDVLPGLVEAELRKEKWTKGAFAGGEPASPTSAEGEVSEQTAPQFILQTELLGFYTVAISH